MSHACGCAKCWAVKDDAGEFGIEIFRRRVCTALGLLHRAFAWNIYDDGFLSLLLWLSVECGHRKTSQSCYANKCSSMETMSPLVPIFRHNEFFQLQSQNGDILHYLFVDFVGTEYFLWEIVAKSVIFDSVVNL